MSSILCIIWFPHKGHIITIDWFSYCQPDPTTADTNVPMVDTSKSGFESIDVDMLKNSSLIGTFSLPPPIYYLDSTLVFVISLTPKSEDGYNVPRDPTHKIPLPRGYHFSFLGWEWWYPFDGNITLAWIHYRPINLDPTHSNNCFNRDTSQEGPSSQEQCINAITLLLASCVERIPSNQQVNKKTKE